MRPRQDSFRKTSQLREALPVPTWNLKLPTAAAACYPPDAPDGRAKCRATLVAQGTP